MFDKELEAIAKCFEVIKDLDSPAQIRVIKYLVERLEIKPQSGSPSVPTNEHNPTLGLMSNPPEVINSAQHDHDDASQDFPSPKQLLLKGYPKNEPEWVLCFAFISSKYGTDQFKKEDILTLYRDSNKLTKSASSNFASNLNRCIKNDWIRDIAGENYVLKPEGVSYAKQIMRGNSVGKEIKKSRKSKLNIDKPE